MIMMDEMISWMGWNEMEDKIKFGYFYKKNPFNVEFKEFKKELLGNKSNKCVQLYINEEPFIVAGNNLYHKDILKLFLVTFNNDDELTF